VSETSELSKVQEEKLQEVLEQVKELEVKWDSVISENQIF
jgi:hypothetical protein